MAAARRKPDENRMVPVAGYVHTAARRTNNPPAGLAHLDRDVTPTRAISYQYDPHLDPVLEWAGKAERGVVEVAAPSIHVQEDLSAERIVASVRKQRSQPPLFEMEHLDPAEVVEFYRHDMRWSNRMGLGDSLTVMMSLIARERLA